MKRSKKCLGKLDFFLFCNNRQIKQSHLRRCYCLWEGKSKQGDCEKWSENIREWHLHITSTSSCSNPEYRHHYLTIIFTRLTIILHYLLLPTSNIGWKVIFLPIFVVIYFYNIYYQVTLLSRWEWEIISLKNSEATKTFYCLFKNFVNFLSSLTLMKFIKWDFWAIQIGIPSDGNYFVLIIVKLFQLLHGARSGKQSTFVQHACRCCHGSSSSFLHYVPKLCQKMQQKSHPHVGGEFVFYSGKTI